MGQKDIYQCKDCGFRFEQDYLNFYLTEEEWRAIRFHMGSKTNLRDKELSKQYSIAQKEQLWYLIHTSDCLSCGNYSKSMRGLVKGIISTFNL
jgi:predicted Zn-ribbon and HTH transcriptional regulator